jgi:hypothetical protein
VSGVWCRTPKPLRFIFPKRSGAATQALKLCNDDAQQPRPPRLSIILCPSLVPLSGLLRSRVPHSPETSPWLFPPRAGFSGKVSVPSFLPRAPRSRLEPKRCIRNKHNHYLRLPSPALSTKCSHGYGHSKPSFSEPLLNKKIQSTRLIFLHRSRSVPDFIGDSHPTWVTWTRRRCPLR